MAPATTPATGSATPLDGPRWRWVKHPTPPGVWLLRLALAVPMAFHGAWNLSLDGLRWWQQDSSLPEELRWLIGLGELAAALSLATGVLSRLAALALVPLMAGAIAQHLEAYSFKVGGFETPLAYLMMALAIATFPSTWSLARRTQEAVEPRLAPLRR